MLENEDVEMHIQSVHIRINELFDETKMRNCIKNFVENKDYLRSIIAYKGLERPLMVFLKQIKRKCYINMEELSKYAFSIEKNPWIFVGDEKKQELYLFYNEVYFDEVSIKNILYSLMLFYTTGEISNETLKYGGVEFYQNLIKASAEKDYYEFTEEYNRLKGNYEYERVSCSREQMSMTEWKSSNLDISYNNAFFSWLSTLISVFFKKECLIGILKNFNGESKQNLVGNYERIIPYAFSMNADKPIDSWKDLGTSVLDIWDCYQLSNRKFNLDSCVIFRNRFDRQKECNMFKIKYSNEYEFFSFQQLHVDIALEISSLEHTELISEYRILYNMSIYDREKVSTILDMFQDTLLQIQSGEVSFLKDIKYQTIENLFTTHSLDKKELFYLEDSKNPKLSGIIDVQRRTSYTYGDFDAHVNCISGYLRKYMYQNNSHPVIGVMMERSYEMLVIIYAIMKSGGAYMPVDHKYPEKRKQYMIQNSECQLIIMDYADCDLNCKQIQYNLLEKHALEEPEDKENYAEMDAPAYVLYTSGSTGKPKGVIITHRAIQNRIDWIYRYAKINEKDTILFKTPYTFDVSVIEILIWKYSLCKVCILPEDEHKNPEKILQTIIENKVTIVHFVPSMLKAFSFYHSMQKGNTLGELRYIFSSGEALERKLIQQVYDTFNINEEEIHILNLYGPTEAAVDVSYYLCSWHEINTIPIGKPIDNVKLYCLDPLHRVLPCLMEGQLAICGICLAEGYINNLELTGQQFITHPLYKQKMYLTGDKAYWRKDQNIIYCGRIDSQVKIRGLRVELGEIKNVILEHPDVLDAEVLLISQKDFENCIVAFVVGTSSLNIDKLMKYILDNVTDYMVPSQIVLIDEVPVNHNGKTDIRVLEEIFESKQKKEIFVRKDGLYDKLLNIWKNVLGSSVYSEEDDFFFIGGDSLKAIYLLTQINNAFCVHWVLNDIFLYPTIRSQVEHLRLQNTSTEKITERNSIIKAEVSEKIGKYMASATQRRIYYMSVYQKNSAYNIMGVYKIANEQFDVKRFENSISKLLEKHSILRTSFTAEGDSIMAVVHQHCEFHVEKIDVNQNIDEYLNLNRTIFDLCKPPLVRVRVIESNNNSYLVIEFSHIIIDGISLSIIMDELQEIYKNPDKELLEEYPYNMFAMDVKDPKLKNYWLSELEINHDSIILQEDFKRPERFTFNGDSLFVNYNKVSINTMAQKHKTTPAVIFLSMLAICAYKMTNYRLFVIGVVASGRDTCVRQRCIGPFVNTLPFKFEIKDNMTVVDVISYTHDKMLQGLQNQDYPIDDIVDELNIERKADRSPLFNMMFTYQADFEKKLGLENVLIEEYSYRQKTAKMDLSIFVHENSGQIEIEYCTDLFHPQTIQALSNRFKIALSWMLENPKRTIGCCNLLTREEENRSCDYTVSGYCRKDTLQKQFDEIVKEYHSREAIRYKNISYTYDDLNRLSDKCMSFLQQQGVVSQSVVAIQLNNSPETIITIIGVLKLGAVYLPIDVKIPHDRCEYMFRKLNVNVVVCEDEECHYSVTRSITRNELVKVLQSQDADMVPYCEGNADDLCYVIFTSGSTGKPKGCLISQANVSNYINWAIKYYLSDYEEQVFFPMFTSISVDLTVTSIFVPLLSGNTIVVYPNEIQSIYELFNDGYTNIVKMTPSHIKLLAGYDFSNSKVKKIIVGGEQLTKTLCDLIHISGIRFYNEYGPTETTVGCMIYEYNSDDTKQISNDIIPIGKGLEHTKIYLLDELGRLCPNNVQGQIYIGGSSVALGYTDRALTNERFIQNPFSNDKNDILFITGDYAYWNYRHEMIYVGRKDEQKKVRGNRIEIAEIEACIQRSKLVNSSFTYVADNSIISCVIGNEKYNKEKLLFFLKRWLPVHMIPNRIINMEHFPINLAGKIDIHQLKELVMNYDEVEEKVFTDNDIQEKIASIWQMTLHHSNFNVYDNFFDVGGNSILLLNMHTEIKKINQNIELMDYFKYPSISELSRYLYIENNILKEGNVFFNIGEKNVGDIQYSEILLNLEQRLLDNLLSSANEYQIYECQLLGAILYVLLYEDVKSDILQIDIVQNNDITYLNGNRTDNVECVIDYLNKNLDCKYMLDVKIAVSTNISSLNWGYDIMLLYSNTFGIKFYYNKYRFQKERMGEICEALLNIIKHIE